MSLSYADMKTWTPPPCSTCGGAQDFSGDWFEVSCMGDPEPSFLPGRTYCRTPKCGQVCRICRREPGDVHGPDCGPLMFNKIERPHIVDWSDCRG